ncbi:MAG TPA: hypothetical protein VHG08_20460 [Longimicrobium sp.]|nr:hypothetical protein [Longimicrobium sp.]
MVDWRRREQPDPFLDWKVGIFFAGAALLMAGIVLQLNVLALVAAVVLAAGLVLTAVDRIRTRRTDPWTAPEDEPENEPAFQPDERA